MAAESFGAAEREHDNEETHATTPTLPTHANAQEFEGSEIPQNGVESKSDELNDNNTELSDVEDEELFPLMNDRLSDDGHGETPADVSFAKTKRQEVMILNIISNTKGSGDTSLDLSQKNLQSLPEEMFELSHIEYMYLEGNDIAFLPDEFFKFFPCLRWLDLRNNQLSRIPSFFLSNHQFLRDLLLEGNNLRGLPLELGLVRSLHGLNIAGNPLDFPPQDIIDRGTQHILGFLRSMMDAKNTAKMSDLGELSLSEEVSDGYEQISASSDDWNTAASMMELAKRREAAGMQGYSADHTPVDVNQCHEEDDYPMGARSAELHRPARHSENKYKHIQKLKKAGALGVVDSETAVYEGYGEAMAWSNLCVARTANCLNIRKCQLTSRTNYDYQDYKQIAKFFKKALKK